jgi:glycosyltransferase involved in cell wall biosynthesis
MMMNGSKTELIVNSGHIFYKFLIRILIRFSDAILLLSNEELKIWSRFNSRGNYFRVVNPFIPNPNELKNQTIEKKKPHTILFVGRLIKEKGIYELIDAMKEIINRVDCQLLVVGEGKEKNAIHDRINNTHLKESVLLMGYLENEKLYQVYQMADVFILPSYREGFSTSITEAMSCGLPIVTTSVGGMPDHLLEGVNTLFIPPGNAVAIVSAVVRLLNDRELRLKMGQANLEKVKEFSPEIVAGNYIEIFSELIESGYIR